MTRPLIRVRIGYNHRLSKTPVTSLIDSGCDRNLFPASWGELIGINIKKGKVISYTGIGKSYLLAYSHFITIYIVNTKISFSTLVDFSYEQQLPLLGRSGFFCYFKRIIFNEENDCFKLEFEKK